jgi:glycosyltransferase involved in cell wall biosynthesis
LLIGNGPEVGKIETLLHEYPDGIKFIPFIPHNEMPKYYQLCDIFIIPRPSTISAETLIPLKILEAMAMGKPVLASDVGGLAEVIKHRVNGYLFEKGNMDEFIKILFQILDEDYNAIGRKARESVLKEYTWKKSAKILEDIYKNFI